MLLGTSRLLKDNDEFLYVFMNVCSDMLAVCIAHLVRFQPWQVCMDFRYHYPLEP